MAVELRAETVIFRSQFDPRHVGQQDDRPVAVAAQADGAEFLRRAQARLGGDGGVERLALGRWRAADLARRYLRILRLDRGLHVARRDAQIGHLVRVQPHPHGILRTQQLGVANPGDATDRILQR